MLAVDSDEICYVCWRKYLSFMEKNRIIDDNGNSLEDPEKNTVFQQWRQDNAESGFGFDPYLERETEMFLYARNSSALVPLSQESLDLIENIKERCPLFDDLEIIEKALLCFQKQVLEIEKDTMDKIMMCELLAEAIKEALKGRDDTGE